MILNNKKYFMEQFSLHKKIYKTGLTKSKMLFNAEFFFSSFLFILKCGEINITKSQEIFNSAQPHCKNASV